MVNIGARYFTPYFYSNILWQGIIFLGDPHFPYKSPFQVLVLTF